MTKQKLIILRGYPGSGKTIVGQQLKSAGVGDFIDHNSILTVIASISGDDDGIYDEIADLEIAICRKLLKQGRTVIIARGFSKLSSIAAYEQIANELKISSIIIRLDVSLEQLMSRVKSPERKLDYNPTVNEKQLADWVAENPLQDHPAEKIVNNENPLKEVTTDIISSIRF